MSLYLALLLASVAVPLILSFDKKLQFYRKWNTLFPAIFIVAAIYIGFDVLMTHLGVWGFNERYHSSIKILGLPLEEWLFFIIIPYASLFIHEAFILYFPKIRLSKKNTTYLTFLIIIILIMVLLRNTEKIYTLYIFSFTLMVLGLSFFDRSSNLSHFYITFLIILIPFILVNAVLTGSFIESEVVWYNNDENLGIRIFTIPIEDFAYAFSMLLLNLQIVQFLKHRKLIQKMNA
jgi:lycopene cyclase domain-containing protein